MKSACRFLLAPALAFSFSAVAAAQDSELLARMRAMEDRIVALEGEIRALKANAATPAAAPSRCATRS